MAEHERVHQPGQVGPVVEGQLQPNREPAQRAPGASRAPVQQAQDALQRDRPEVVQEAAARHRDAREGEAAGRSSSAGAAPAPAAPPGGP